MFNKKLLSSIDLGKYAKKNPYKKDMILDPMGQWKHPGKNTRIPSSSITMKGVNYPVLGVSNTGQKQMMQPGQEYNFPGADYVDEYPQMKKGGAKKKYTSDIINSTNYLFAEHPLFKKKKQSKKRIYDPKAKYYQFGGLTRFTNLAGKTLKLPPAILNESNILPIISNLKPASSISKDLKIAPGVKGLLADARYRSGIENGFPLIEYDFPSASIRQLGDYKYQPYSEGWWAEHDMKSALEQPQWVPGKEDFFIDQEIVDLVKQQKDYNKSLAAFDEMHPESLDMVLMRALSGDTSRDELFANLFPNASMPNFRSKILSPEQTAALNRIELQNRSFQNKAGLSNPALKTLGVGQDILPKQYNDLLTFYKGSNWLQTAPAKDVVMEMRGLPELKGVDIKNASPLQLETWKDKIVKKMEKQAIERWKKDRGDKLTGLDAYNKMLNQSGSRNKYGGQLSKAKYGHSIGNLIRKQKGGQLPRAQFGLAGTGEDRSLSFTPFDFRSSYGQTSDFNRNPNYSLTYNTPKLFKKADLAGNPLSITLGRPYNTDTESLTNRTLNFMPQEGLFSSYYDPATQGGSNPQYQQYLQNVSGTTGTPVSELNQTVINQYNAAKNLAGAKPLYKKGIPLTANVGWDFIGNAFGDASSGPFTGYGSFNAGYAPEPGLYGTADLGMMGVFGRRKNNASIKPQRYFDKGLTRQGDMAFIPKLNILNVALRQRPEYNESQTQQILDAYAKDIEQGTTTAKDFITNKTDESKFDLSFLSPELTYQVKPFKDIPGILSATAGARLDYGGKDSSGNRIPIKPLPYGNVRYTVPIEGAIDKLKDLNLPAVKRKKTYNDYANDQEYDEEYTGDTPQEDTPTENNIEVNPPELQVNPNGTVLDRGDCPEGYERPCPKCRCEKIKMPQMYTDKRGTHLFGNEPIRFKDGGEKEAMNAMMKARLAYANEFNNPSAERMINIPDQPYEFDNGDMGTHYMASMDNYAVPQIQSVNGVLQIGDYGPESNEAMRFDSDEDANYFAENYKNVSPGFMDVELDDNEIDKYVNGGYIVEDISIPSLTRMQPGGLIKSLKPVIKGTKSLKLPGSPNAKTFISEINWSKWNPETPNYPELITEYNGIEELTKKTGTWMKNPDGSPYQGAPEQFIQEQSSHFRKAYPEGYNEVFRGVTDLNSFKDFTLSKNPSLIGDKAIFTADKNLATSYAFNSGNVKPMLNPFISDNTGGVYDLIYPKGKQITYNTGRSDWLDINLSKNSTKENLQYQIDTVKKHYERLKNLAKDANMYEDVEKDILNGQKQIIENLQSLYDNFDNVIHDKEAFAEMRKVLGDVTSTDAIAEYLPKTDLRSVTLQNIIDGGLGDVTIVNNRPGNYLKSRVGNVGFFNMNNPNIYKGLVPLAVGAGAGALMANPYQDQSPIGKYKNGGQYGLGDEVDEATMKQLKKLGFTFEKIK